MSLHIAEAYLESLLGQDTSRSGYRLMPAKPGERVEVLPGHLYRFTLRGGPTQRVVTLSIFLGVGDLGNALWEQELRTLERLSALNHPALPELVDGGRLDGVSGHIGAAYVRTVRNGYPASEGWFDDLAHAKPGRVLSHLWMLADALGVLHDARCCHRSLWPGALAATLEGDDDTRNISSVQLVRFEQSALTANLFNSRSVDVKLGQVREAYLLDDPAALIYSPPERLRFLFKQGGDLGGPKGDVFSLGMIAANWLVAGTPEVGPIPEYDSLIAAQEEVRRQVTVADSRIPASVAKIIARMLEHEPGARPTAFEVAQVLSAGFADASRVLDDETPDMPYLVAYMPSESDRTLLKWGEIQDSAMTPAGQNQLVELIESDMRGAEIVHSPTGAEGFATGDDPARLRRAKTVVIGSRVTWFCDRFWLRDPRGGTVTFENLLLIKYVRQTKRIQVSLDRLRVNALVRRVPMVEAEPAPMDDIDAAEFLVSGRPSWDKLVNRNESGLALSEKERDYIDALAWYLQYQNAMLAARTYAVDIDEHRDVGFDRVALRWNPENDRTRKFGLGDDLSRVAVLDTRRPTLTALLAGAQTETEDTRVHLADLNSPQWTESDTYEVVDVYDPDTVVVSLRGRRKPSSQGWLRLAEDSGTTPQIALQRGALRQLTENRVLLNSLISPQRWHHPNSRWDNAGGTLRGDGRKAVRAILEHDGIFAVQGPPGTGKTEVAAQAVADYLQQQPGARILVSAQSHDALENLAVRITRKLGITVPPGSSQRWRLDRLALRVRSGTARAESHGELDVLQPDSLVRRIEQYSSRRAAEWLRLRRAEFPELAPVVERWLARVPNATFELLHRVRTAANVVFATTGASSERNLFADATIEPFDWVIVEEAAKAWPTELALPLVWGLRWTLIGDHAQIGAYSRETVERFLEELVDYEEPGIKIMYEARQRYSDNFSTFARIFDGPTNSTPTLTLFEQYRMDAVISGLVGDHFYAASGGLQAMREPADHPLIAPGLLTSARLVWIDTGLASRSVPHWANEFEGDICATVVRAMRPAHGASRGLSLAVLTPYRNQVEVLQKKMTEHHTQIFTIDGFQGREADIVVASLVRDRIRTDSGPIGNAGHLAVDNRINVMLSRARELLVLVGRIELYEKHAGPAWKGVVARFRRDGIVVTPEDWIGG